MNKYPQEPQAVYDLHGVHSYEVTDELQACMLDAKEHGYMLIHIIVGKGHHSGPNGPVVRVLTQELLIAWGYRYRFAKRHEGGEGVIVVQL
ncbi:Smr/MutS family protein [Candidatus Nomurabacteria bacterium]|nr:Smr/MutS family protein [Candidatus Nomurabacteria bacterium]